MPINKKCIAPMKRTLQALNAIPKGATPQERAEQAAMLMGEYGQSKPSASDKIIAYQVNSLLSGTQTALANIVSIPVQGVLTPINQAIAAVISKARGQDSSVFDVLMGFHNLTENFMLAGRMAKEGYLRGFPLDVQSTVQQMAYNIKGTKAEALQVVDNLITATRAKVAAENSNRPFNDVLKEMQESGIVISDKERQMYLNDNFDYMRKTFTGSLSQYIEVPTKVTVGIDEFGKSFFRLYGVQQQIATKARRDAKGDGKKFWELYNSYRRDVLEGATGNDAKVNLANLQKNMGEVFGAGGTDLIPYENLREFAASKLFQQALTGKPRAVQKLMQDSPAMRLFIPFMKTPWNIVKEGLSYTPVGLIAKATLRGKADDATKRGAYYELSNDEMIARQIVGASAFYTLASAYDSDNITGVPRNSREFQQWKDEGKPQQSIKIGDTWYGYGRIEPIARFVQLYSELRRVYDESSELKDGAPKSASQLGHETMLALKASVMDQTFLEGLNDMINATAEGNVGAIPQTIARQAVPTLASNVARTMDGKERQVTGDWMEKTIGGAQQRIPYFRDMLPEEYGLYGEARTTDDMQVWTGFTASKESNRTAVQKAMDYLDIDKVRPNDKLRGIGMSSEQLATYRKDVAEFLTPRLEGLVRNTQFQTLPDGVKRERMRDLVDKWKGMVAKQTFVKLYKTDPEFALKFRARELSKMGLDEQARETVGQF